MKQIKSCHLFQEYSDLFFLHRKQVRWPHPTGIIFVFVWWRPVTTGLGDLLTWIRSAVWPLAVRAALMGLGPFSVCSHGVFMEGNISSGGPSFLHRQADHRLPGKGPVADSLSKACKPGTAAGPEGPPITFRDGQSILWSVCMVLESSVGRNI